MKLGTLFSTTLGFLRDRAAYDWRVILSALAAGGLWFVPLAGANWMALAMTLAALALYYSIEKGAQPVNGDRLRAFGQRTPLLFVSLLLIGFILVFLAVMTLMASGLGAFAIMTGSGFDFEAIGASNDPQAAFNVALEAYQQTLGWQVVLGMFLVALFLFFIAVARSLPVVAASAMEKRIVALEAFNWTRKQGLKLFVAGLVFIALPLAAAISSAVVLNATVALLFAALFTAGAIIGWAALSRASYQLLRPEP